MRVGMRCGKILGMVQPIACATRKLYIARIELFCDVPFMVHAWDRGQIDRQTNRDGCTVVVIVSMLVQLDTVYVKLEGSKSSSLHEENVAFSERPRMQNSNITLIFFAHSS